jgi:hypothetical protein
VEIGKNVRIKKRKVDSPLNGKIGTIEAENPDGSVRVKLDSMRVDLSKDDVEEICD